MWSMSFCCAAAAIAPFCILAGLLYGHLLATSEQYRA